MADIPGMNTTIFDGKESPRYYLSSIVGLVLLTVVTLGYGLIYTFPRILYLVLRALTTHYKIDDQKIIVEHGILSRGLDSMDLWRVQDVRLMQGPFQRIFGEATLALITQDKTDRLMMIRGVGYSQARAIFEKLQPAIAASRQGNRVVGMTF